MISTDCLDFKYLISGYLPKRQLTSSVIVWRLKYQLMTREKNVLIKNKMKLLIGLLVVGIALLVGGSLFLLLSPHQAVTKITLAPSLGSYLLDSENEPSEVLLQTVQMNKGISDKQYNSVNLNHPINVGKDILEINGTIQNNDQINKYITLYAEGYDTKGKQVVWTLDAYIQGYIVIHLETGETSEFTLHLNFTENVKSIRIYASNYGVPPP